LNVNDDSEVQRARHDLPRIVTDDGIEIDLSDEQSENASASIRVSLESDSNVSIESDRH
jgi:hypothetical protein